MKSNVAGIMSEMGGVLFIDGEVFNIGPDHPNLKEITLAYREKRWEDIPTMVNVSKAVEDYLGLDVRGGLVYLDDEPFSEAVSEKVLKMKRDGYDASFLLNFLRKVRENPSATAQRELLLFCEANSFLIHEDGDIVAYKGVREDYKDCHSGKFDNSVGAVVEMDRSKVDDRRDVTCSFGLHFGSLSQANGYGNRTMVIKVHPKDVVSIPNDYNNSKGRCCKYTVVAELPRTRTGLPPREVYSDRDIAEHSAYSMFADDGRDYNYVDIIDDVLNIMRAFGFADPHPSDTVRDVALGVRFTAQDIIDELGEHWSEIDFSEVDEAYTLSDIANFICGD